MKTLYWRQINVAKEQRKKKLRAYSVLTLLILSGMFIIYVIFHFGILMGRYLFG